MDPTVDQLKSAARRKHAEGTPEAIADAKRYIALARELESKEKIEATPPIGVDVAKAGGAGVVRGAAEAADFAEAAQPYLRAGLPMTVAMKLFGEKLPSAQAVDIPERTEPTMREMAAQATGGFSEYQGRSIPAQYAGTGGEFIGGAVAMPFASALRTGGGALARGAERISRSVGGSILPAIASETAGQVTKGTELEGAARLAAALGTPLAQAAITPYARKMAIGDPSEVQSYLRGSTRPQSVQALREAGVEDISAGQEIGSEQLMRLEGRLGPTTPAKSQLTRAVAKEAGIDLDADVLSASTVSANRNRLGDVFNQADDLAGGVPTQEEGMRAVNLVSSAEALMSEGTKVPKTLKDAANTIGNAFIDGAELNGATIKQVRAQLNKAIKQYAPAMDKQIELGLAEDLLDALDDMVVRQVSQTAPDFIPRLSTARQQYRAHLTMERALTGGGQQKASGLITPESLASAAGRREGVSYVRGTGTPLADLARASQEVLTPLPRVGEGGVRFEGGRIGSATKMLPSMIASRMQPTLPMSGTEAISTRLLERLARQTGGLLSID